ncbi:MULTISPECIES: TetR/AcrR family transcriptional regulator [unclassified Raoultella]|uniref:TetR/AcrR family transcriptional regulator n=1 Tax=unclassified Raoultella TaxID=2627600 RepID=UPI00135B7270|nr:MULTISPECIES: TetR/AcrR family transcriptional regulator [unclassified Raoultella]
MAEPLVRQRLSREERHTQLVDVAWRIIREEGTEALTLGYLAKKAGVTKPVVYDHFDSRSGLFATLYREFDRRQTALMDEILRKTEPDAEKLASVIATSYIECVLLQGREMPSVMAALAGTPELEKIKQEYMAAFTLKCRELFAPLCGGQPLSDATILATIGSAEGLSAAVVSGVITEQQAKNELFQVIMSMLNRCCPPPVAK